MGSAHVFSTEDEELSYIVQMLAGLKRKGCYDGLQYLAESARHFADARKPPSHRAGGQPGGAKSNCLCRGRSPIHIFTAATSVTLSLSDRQLVDQSNDAQFYVRSPNRR
jgi:hypothetical protein